MKIAFLTPEFPHPKIGSSGGIGTSILNLSKGLIQLGYEVSVLVYGQDKDEVFEENGISFYKIKNVKVKGLSLLLTQLKVKKLINSLYKAKKIDIVEAADWTGFTSFIKLKCPLILKLHGSDTYFCYLENRHQKWKNRFLEKRAFQNADGIISVSQYTGDLTNELFKLKRNFAVIPNAIDPNHFRGSTLKDNVTILYFGTLIRKKGMLELPLIFNEVHKRNSDAKLILIGNDSPDVISGTKSTWLLMQKLFDQSAIKQVHYLGSVSYSEIKQKISKATVCVFPTFAEALPVSWLEAMAMEKVIVASNIGWANEIIEDGVDGYLIHPKNHFEFSNQILELLANESLRAKIALKAREKVEAEFSADVIAIKTLKFYSKFL